MEAKKTYLSLYLCWPDFSRKQRGPLQDSWPASLL